MSGRRELERSGSVDPGVRRQERRAGDLHRQAGRRLDSLETSIFQGARCFDVSLTTTAQAIEHGLGRAFRGAFFVQQDGAGHLIATSSANDAVWINLAVDAGTVSGCVVVF